MTDHLKEAHDSIERITVAALDARKLVLSLRAELAAYQDSSFVQKSAERELENERLRARIVELEGALRDLTESLRRTTFVGMRSGKTQVAAAFEKADQVLASPEPKAPEPKAEATTLDLLNEQTAEIMRERNRLATRVGELEGALDGIRRIRPMIQGTKSIDEPRLGWKDYQDAWKAVDAALAVPPEPEPKAPEPVRTRPPAPASEPKTSQRSTNQEAQAPAPVPPESVRAEEGNPPPAGTLLACGHVMGDGLCREHCRYPSEAAPAPREPVMCSCGREFDTPQALWDHYVKDGASDEERESHGATTPANRVETAAGEFRWLGVDPDVSPLSAPFGSIPPAVAKARTRVARFSRTTGVFTGGNNHPDRCMCQREELGQYSDTPHVHYDQPPFACARCSCPAYRPAVPTDPPQPPAPLDGHDARDEEVAALKAEVERLRRTSPSPREPCCDLASRGTHRKGCTGEPRSKQLADALGGEAALTDAELLSRADQHALRAMIGYIARCGSRTLGEDALAACRAAVAARKEPKP